MQDQSGSYMCAKACGSSQHARVLCIWSEHAGVGSFQSTSERSPESSRRTACRNRSDFQGAWKFWACWYPFGYGASWCIIGFSCESMQEQSFFLRTPTQTHASQSRQNQFSKADRLFFSTLWCWCFVSFLQERDECSKEIARMRLEEKYEVEMSQLAKGSQAVPSFTWEH